MGCCSVLCYIMLWYVASRPGVLYYALCCQVMMTYVMVYCVMVYCVMLHELLSLREPSQSVFKSAKPIIWYRTSFKNETFKQHDSTSLKASRHV